MACTHRIKFIEVSVAINHNVDELLAGVLSQIRLKKAYCAVQVILKQIHNKPGKYKLFPYREAENPRQRIGIKIAV